MSPAEEDRLRAYGVSEPYTVKGRCLSCEVPHEVEITLLSDALLAYLDRKAALSEQEGKW